MVGIVDFGMNFECYQILGVTNAFKGNWFSGGGSSVISAYFLDVCPYSVYTAPNATFSVKNALPKSIV